MTSLTAKELSKWIGRTGLVQVREDMRVRVKVVDIKDYTDQTALKVEPLAGKGSMWIYLIELSNVTKPDHE